MAHSLFNEPPSPKDRHDVSKRRSYDSQLTSAKLSNSSSEPDDWDKTTSQPNIAVSDVKDSQRSVIFVSNHTAAEHEHNPLLSVANVLQNCCSRTMVV